MPLDPRRERIARNEASFREINERLEQGLRQVPDSPELHPFVCECGSAACEATIELGVEEYEEVRRDSRHFAVRAGHVYDDAERVVATHDRYQVVEKFPAAEAIADATDPRGGGRRD